MQKRSIVLWLALAAVVIGLAAVTLDMREDDEPEALEPAVAQPAATRDRRPSKRHAQSESDSLPAVGDAEYRGCEHPLIPSMVGEWREYRWEQTHTDHDASGEMRLEARTARELEGGQGEITWHARMTAGSDTEPSETLLTARCSSTEAEEPWFGVVDHASGRSFMRGSGRWRWPAELSAGATVNGTAAFRLSPEELEELGPTFARTPERATRRHTVARREDIEVPAGRFSAWRVEYEEERALTDHVRRGNGTLWIAPGAGLVRSRAVTERGAVETIELVSLGHAR